MKKNYLILAAGLIIASCQQRIEPQEEVTFIEIESLSNETQLFVPLADIATQYGNDSESRKLIYNEIDKQFDGDNNVLFATMLASKNTVNGKTTKTEVTLKTEAALQSFKNIKNVEPLYPQIFIPNYEELKEMGEIGKEQPIIIFRDGPPTANGEYQGYAFKNDKLLNKGMISEEYAAQHEVWVIGVNERVDANGKIPIEVKMGDTNGKLLSYQSPAIEGLAIHGTSCMKEDWIGGAAEVAWTARIFFNSYDTSDKETYLYSGRGAESHPRDNIREVSRRSARNDTYQNLASENKYFVYDWSNDPRYNTYYEALHTIFEYDPWPAGVQTSTIGNYTDLSLEYRSYESSFLAERVFRGNMGSHWVDTGCFGIIID